MNKLFLIGLSSAALLSAFNVNSSIAETNNPSSAQSESKAAPASQAERTGPSDNQIANDVDAKIAKLKADLRLTSDQEKNWPGLQTALHDNGVGEFKTLAAGRSARADRDERPNDIVMMRDEANELNAKAASLKKLADAADPLYGSLDDRQKHKLIQFMTTEIEHR